MILSFLSQKGGVGKSTLSINAAAYLAQSGRVLLIDADQQASSSAWASLREQTPFRVVSMSRDNLTRDVMEMAVDYTHTVIDGPPRAQRAARSIIMAADVVLIPVEPSGLSTWAASETVAQVREAMDIKPVLKCAFVVSKKIGGTVIGRSIRDMVAAEGFPILKTEIQLRVPFAECVTVGQSIHEYAPASAAAREIEDLMTEVQNWVNEDAKTKLRNGKKAARANG